MDGLLRERLERTGEAAEDLARRAEEPDRPGLGFRVGRAGNGGAVEGEGPGLAVFDEALGLEAGAPGVAVVHHGRDEAVAGARKALRAPWSGAPAGRNPARRRRRSGSTRRARDGPRGRRRPPRSPCPGEGNERRDGAPAGVDARAFRRSFRISIAGLGRAEGGGEGEKADGENGDALDHHACPTFLSLDLRSHGRFGLYQRLPQKTRRRPAWTGRRARLFEMGPAIGYDFGVFASSFEEGDHARIL